MHATAVSMMGEKIDEHAPAACLYERLLGGEWQQLPAAVRKAHDGVGDVHARGTFRIRRGPGRIARVIASLVRLPVSADAAAVELHIVRTSECERWERTFATRRMVTVQCQAPGQLLAERYGLIEYRLRLVACDFGLRYEQQSVALRAARLRLPLPKWLAPRVFAEERAADTQGRTHVSVAISLPTFGPLIEYAGELKFEEPQ